MYEKELQLAMEAAQKAGDYLNRNLGKQIDSNIGKDIKMEVDKKSEEIILEALKPSGIPILSEECGYISGDSSEYIWIIDPLDGTANYWKDIKELTCVSIALWSKGHPVLGVINRFSVNELYSGVVGMGAWLNEVDIRTATVSKVKDAFVATGFPVKRDYGEKSLSDMITLVQKFKKVRMLGAAAIMGVFVACGKIDVYMEEEIMLWDIAASAAIVKAAGGSIEIEMLEDYKTICRLFANELLRDDFKREIEVSNA